VARDRGGGSAGIGSRRERAEAEDAPAQREGEPDGAISEATAVNGLAPHVLAQWHWAWPESVKDPPAMGAKRQS
jgi:hypothetical protein